MLGCSCGCMPVRHVFTMSCSSVRTPLVSNALCSTVSQPRAPGFVQRASSCTRASASLGTPESRGLARRANRSLRSTADEAHGTLPTDGSAGSSIPASIAATYSACALVHSAAA